MATDAQKARHITWIETDAEGTTETWFHGFQSRVSSLQEKKLVSIWNSRGEVLYQQWVTESQRQAEIRAEVQLKNLSPKEVTRAFGRNFQKKGI